MLLHLQAYQGVILSTFFWGYALTQVSQKGGKKLGNALKLAAGAARILSLEAPILCAPSHLRSFHSPFPDSSSVHRSWVAGWLTSWVARWC